jgi:hypothetical protein
MSGRWRERRQWWDGHNLEGAAGRADALTFDTGNRTDELAERMNTVGTTSVFDPVLAEICLRWWSPPDGVVLDPFAGGSTRGVVAAMCGRQYHGVDISRTQIDANEDCAWKLRGEYPVAPQWYEADSATWQPTIWADFILSCPPYGSLERYSDDPRDLSTMTWGAFGDAYRQTIGRSVSRLRPDRFAVFVVGNYREGNNYRDLCSLTVQAFGEADANYYGDLVLKNSTASSGMRASASFDVGRKPIRTHQNVLVFVKGDWRKAAAAAERYDAGESCV